MKSWCEHDCFESIVSSKKLYLQNVERVMILNCSRVNCIIKRLHSSCDWSSNIFSLYDLFEIWLLDMIVRISCFIKDCIYKARLTLNASWYLISTWLFKSIVSSKNCICDAIDFQIRFCCNDLFVLSMSMCWYVDFSEAFFSLLVWIFSTTRHEKRHCIDVIWLTWILNYARLKTSWLFVHWLANWIYFWTCSADKLSSWKQIAFLKFLRSSYDEYTVHALLFDNLLWDSRNVSSFQFQWTETIAYRVICDEMFVANLWFMLAYLDFVKMFYSDTIFRSFWLCAHVRIWRDVLSARNWRMSRCLIFVMFEFWRDVLFVCNWCMIRDLTIDMFQYERDVLQLICISLSICRITCESIHKF